MNNKSPSSPHDSVRKRPLRNLNAPDRAVEFTDEKLKQVYNSIVSCAIPPKSSEAFHTLVGLPPATPAMLDTVFSATRDRSEFDAAEMDLPKLRDGLKLYLERIREFLASRKQVDKSFPVRTRILELGAGGAITPEVIKEILKHQPDVSFDFVDIDPQALESLKQKIRDDEKLSAHSHQFRFIVTNFTTLLEHEKSEYGERYDLVLSELFHHHVYYQNGRNLGQLYKKVLLPSGAVFELDQFVGDFDTEESRIQKIFAAHQAILAKISFEPKNYGLVRDEIRSLYDAMQPPRKNERIDKNLRIDDQKKLSKFIRENHDLFLRNFIARSNSNTRSHSSFEDEYKSLEGKRLAPHDSAHHVNSQWFHIDRMTLTSLGIAVNGDSLSKFGKGLLFKMDEKSHDFFIREPKGNNYKQTPCLGLKNDVNICFFDHPKKEHGKYLLVHDDDGNVVGMKLAGYGGISEQKRRKETITNDMFASGGIDNIGSTYLDFERCSASMLPEAHQGGIYIKQGKKKEASISGPDKFCKDFKNAANRCIHALSGLMKFDKKIDLLWYFNQFDPRISEYLKGMLGNDADSSQTDSQVFMSRMMNMLPDLQNENDSSSVHSLFVSLIGNKSSLSQFIKFFHLLDLASKKTEVKHTSTYEHWLSILSPQDLSENIGGEAVLNFLIIARKIIQFIFELSDIFYIIQDTLTGRIIESNEKSRSSAIREVSTLIRERLMNSIKIPSVGSEPIDSDDSRRLTTERINSDPS